MTRIFDHEAVPVIKPTVQRNDIDGNIFLRTSSRVTEISKDTVFHRIADSLDGKKSMADLNAMLQTEGFSCKEIASAFEDLDSLLLLEDSRGSSNPLTDNEVRRWARNLNFFGSFSPLGTSQYEPQAKIRDAKVTLLGLGGLGSHILYDLAALGCKNIVAVEFDCVELSNLNRQILYTPADIGRHKAEVAKERILQFSPDMDFRVFDQKIEGADDVLAAIEGRDIAICVADRPKTEILYWVNAACVKSGIALITGGLDTQVARYYCTLAGEGCLECWRNAVKESDARADAILEEQRRTQLRGDNAAFVPFVAIIAGLMIAEFSKIITGIGGPLTAQNRTREIHFSRMAIETGETWEKDPACPCCGQHVLAGHSSLAEA